MPLRGLEYSHRNHSPVEGFCRSLMGRGASAPGVEPQIARLDVLGPGVRQNIQHIGLRGGIAVLGGRSGEIRRGQILLAPQPVPQELAVIGGHGTGAPQKIHGLHTLIGVLCVQVQRAQEARHYLLRGVPGQILKFCQRSGQRVQSHLHSSAFLSFFIWCRADISLSRCWRRWRPCSTRRRHAARSTAHSSPPRRCTSRRRAFRCSSSFRPCRYGECRPRRPAFP